MFTFFYVEPKNKVQKVDAAVPFILPILGSIAFDVAIDSGIDFVDKKAETEWKEKTAGKIWNKFGDKIAKLKPTKKNAGKWGLEIGKELMAGIIDIVGDSADEVIEIDTKRKDKNKGGKHSSLDTSTGDDLDPLYNTGISITIENQAGDKYAKGTNFMLNMMDIHIKPNAFKQTSTITFCAGSCFPVTMPGGTDKKIQGIWDGSSSYSIGVPNGERLVNQTGAFQNVQKVFNKQLEVLESKNTISHYGGGVVVTAGHQSVLNLPDNVTSSDLDKIDFSKLPPKYQVDKDFEFDIDIGTDFDGVKDGDYFDWELIDDYIVNKNYDYRTNNSITYNFDIDIIYNNDYELTDKEQGDIDAILPPNKGDGDGDIIVGGGSSGMVCTEDGKIIPCEKVEKIDGSLLAYVENAYEYATGFVKTAVDGLKSLGTGAVELTKLYGIFFGWLPKEIVVLMSSGLAIMLGLRIFRK